MLGEIINKKLVARQTGVDFKLCGPLRALPATIPEL